MEIRDGIRHKCSHKNDVGGRHCSQLCHHGVVWLMMGAPQHYRHPRGCVHGLLWQHPYSWDEDS